MTTRCLTLRMIFAALVSISGCMASRPEEAPKAQAATNANQKPWSELIIGTWKRDNAQSTPKLAGEHRLELTRDGTVKMHLHGKDGAGIPYQQDDLQAYLLEGSTLRFVTFPSNGPPTTADYVGHGLVLKAKTIVIDFPNEDTLTLTTTIRTKYGPEELELRVKGGLGSRKEVAAEVFEQRLRGVYHRVKAK